MHDGDPWPRSVAKSDTLGRFLEESCNFHPTARVSSTRLLESYRDWETWRTCPWDKHLKMHGVMLAEQSRHGSRAGLRGDWPVLSVTGAAKGMSRQ
jgi:hypothetical protein